MPRDRAVTDLGVDTGGTFTDAVAADGSVAKVLSTRDDPGRAVRAAVDDAGGRRPAERARPRHDGRHQRAARAARARDVALVTNAGFADVIEIGRQDRPSLYDPFADRPAPLVAAADRFEVDGRLAADGAELTALGPTPDVGEAVAVAVCLLHADVNPAHEQAVAATLRAGGVDVTCSHEVSPEFREYERTLTTVVNAYLRPVCRQYLTGLAGLADDVLVMTSAGGLVPLADAVDVPAALLLSGPAGGVRAAAAVAAANGFADAVAFDMGGTSTDVCLIRGGLPEPAPGRTVGGFPIRLPSLDVHTIGAGGGSIAAIDPGGALVVGPASAGADPGRRATAGVGRPRRSPTPTSWPGASRPTPTFPDLGRLDAAAARAALAGAGVDADGVIRVVDANMEQALRVVSVARGVDPRGLALVAFGGAGPLHACGFADALGMASGRHPAPRRRAVGGRPAVLAAGP